MAIFYPIKHTVDGYISVRLSLDQALTLLQILAYVRSPGNDEAGYELTRALSKLSEEIYSIVGEEKYDMIRCIETNDSGDVDVGEIKEFCLELTDETVSLVNEHKEAFLAYQNRTDVITTKEGNY